MILNLSKIKTESLLLFCKDLINSYKDKNDIDKYGINKEVIEKFDSISDEMLKEILRVTNKDSFYLENRKHYRIKAILDAYNFINQELSKELSTGEAFNPSMLYFAMFAVWFKELNKESRSKEYIYFILYPYGLVYDKLLIEMKDRDFRRLNIKMIELAEKIIFKLDRYSFIK